MRKCPGCISEDSQPLDGGYVVDTSDLADDIINTSGIEGITISGGEPFLQETALVDLISRVKSKRDIGVILYTGNTFSEIESCELTNVCDLIVDGIYIDKLNDDLSLRGSSNQKVCIVTDRYREEAKEHYGAVGRKIELHLSREKKRLVGIPDKKSLCAFR
jgi:anaerobic ribonucleoside-triphosphate reductase activating protein